MRVSLVYLSLVYLAFSPDDLWLFTTGVSLPLVHVRLKPNPTPYTLNRAARLLQGRVGRQCLDDLGEPAERRSHRCPRWRRRRRRRGDDERWCAYWGGLYYCGNVPQGSRPPAPHCSYGGAPRVVRCLRVL